MRWGDQIHIHIIIVGNPQKKSPLGIPIIR